MTGDEEKAQAAFQDTVRRAAGGTGGEGEPAHDRLWFFREARWRCLAVSEQGLQAEAVEMPEVEISGQAPTQIARLEPAQLAIWIAGAPEPQRSALAFYYLDEFNYRELMSLLDLKLGELGNHLARGRREFQAWLHDHLPEEE